MEPKENSKDPSDSFALSSDVDTHDSDNLQEQVRVASSNDPQSLDALEGPASVPVNPPHSVLEPSLESESHNNFPIGPSEKPGLENPVIIEIFCGSARVTACLKMVGLTSSFGVDHIKGKAISTCKVADLTTEAGQQLLLTWLKAPNVRGVFLAPPCGTCSKARSIILRDSKGRPLPGPVPLRSETFPEGLSNLSPLNQKRVSLANALYEFLGRIIRIADSKGMIIVVENPRSSLFWLTKWWKLRGVKLTYTAHQACAYGSQRPKWTVLAHNRPHFCKICKTCPGIGKNHAHLPWGVIQDRTSSHFATSEETAYPLQLAGAIATAFAKSLMDEGWNPPVDSLDLDWNSVTFSKIRASVGDQPKASKLPPIVREHQFIILIKGPQASLSLAPVKPRERLKAAWTIPTDCDSPASVVPIEAQLLRLSPLRSKGGIHEVDSKHPYEQAWGIPFTPDDFIKEAYVAGHPRSFKNLLPQPIEHALNLNMQMQPSDLVALRAGWFKKWIGRIEELESQEIALKESMPDHLKRILQPKRLLVFREMLSDLNYPDMEVFDEIVNGTVLSGEVSDCGLFEKVFRPCEMTKEQLQSNAGANRKSIFHSSRSSGDREVDDIVYAKTLEEVEAGWLRGPIEFSSLPENAIVNRRFGLKQPNKVRLIDDFSASHVNSTVQSFESPKPHNTDVIASVVLSLLRCNSTQFLGRAYDLKSAYRQLGINKESLWASYVVVYNPNKRAPEVFQLLAVPFGATRAVYSFLRVAHSLWWLGCMALGIIWSNFFDDFICFTSEVLTSNTDHTIDLFFRCLGWKYAVDGDKSSEFSENFSALGIEVNLKNFTNGFAEFKNTDRRIAELCGYIDKALSDNALTLLDAQKLRGRMQFADGQLFGRLGRLCLRAVTEHAYSGRGTKLPQSCVLALRRFKNFLQHSPPRRIQRSSHKTWMIFTDACYEPTSACWKCGIGGVIVSPDGTPYQAFSLQLGDEEINALGGDRKDTIIFEAELLAVVVAMGLWAPLLQCCPTIFFIDNNAVRDVSISGSGRSSVACCLIEELLMFESDAATLSWFARVPSPSNPSDKLSRGDLSDLSRWKIQAVNVLDWTNTLLSKLPSVNGGL